MLQFAAGLVVTSNPFCVNGKEFLSRNREMFGDMCDRAREASPMRRAHFRQWVGRADRAAVSGAAYEA